MEANSVTLSRAEKLASMYACDAKANGLFITGVITTGIYCLPSCPARKPKAENVRFFDSESDAYAAGLRPCKRCKPEYFYANIDPDHNRFLSLLENLKRDPGSVSSVSDLANRIGIGQSKLYEIVQRFDGTTPGEMIHTYRIKHAKYLLSTCEMSVAATAYEVGYDSMSAFYDRFKQLTGSTPGAFRKRAGRCR